jgi:hypothetical protein
VQEALQYICHRQNALKKSACNEDQRRRKRRMHFAFEPEQGPETPAPCRGSGMQAAWPQAVNRLRLPQPDDARPGKTLDGNAWKSGIARLPG